MSNHVEHHGPLMTLSAGFILAMVSFGELRKAEGTAKPVKVSRAVKAKPTNWKTKRDKK